MTCHPGRRVQSDGPAQSSGVGRSRPPAWSGCVGGVMRRVTVNGSHVRESQLGSSATPDGRGHRGGGGGGVEALHLTQKSPGAERTRVGPGAPGSPDTLPSRVSPPPNLQ